MEARKIVADVVSYHNEQRVHLVTEEVLRQRWDEALKNGKGKFRTLDPAVNLDLVFLLHYERTVKKTEPSASRGRNINFGTWPGPE